MQYSVQINAWFMQRALGTRISDLGGAQVAVSLCLDLMHSFFQLFLS
jgi:hypothetical protein